MERWCGVPVNVVVNTPLGFVLPVYAPSLPRMREMDRVTFALATSWPPDVTVTVTLVEFPAPRMLDPRTIVTSRRWNGGCTGRAVDTVPPTYCGLLTVAHTVTSRSSDTVGAVHDVENRPFASVVPVSAPRVPPDAVRATVAPATGVAPLASVTATWIVVDPPDATDVANDDTAIFMRPSWGSIRPVKDHTLLIPPNMSTQPSKLTRSYASSVW